VHNRTINVKIAEIAGILKLKIYHTVNTKMFRHPKYYKALRAERRKHQASSSKQQAPSTKPEPSSGSEASSNKHQASSYKRQA
jgi:hypothetical protein